MPLGNKIHALVQMLFTFLIKTITTEQTIGHVLLSGKMKGDL